MPHIICTVTNDLTYDQRMQRICTSLSSAGYEVTLVGREMPDSVPLQKMNYQQVRLQLKYYTGKLFYAEFNWKLYRWLRKEYTRLAGKKVAIYTVDLDTIVPGYFVSEKFNLPRLYDAHELFSELTEVKRRPLIAAIWKLIERRYVRKYTFGYSVNQFIKDELNRRYEVNYEVVRNMPLRLHSENKPVENFHFALPATFFLYQGAVNEGRAFDELIPAMRNVSIPLVIVGNGNYFKQVEALIKTHALGHKVILAGNIAPSLLRLITQKALAGITLFNNTGLNQYYSLANRFFDYAQAEIPQLCNDYPEYEALNKQHKVALLLHELTSEAIALSLNKLADDDVLYNELKQHAKIAAKDWCWENESVKMLKVWNNLLPIETTHH